MGEATSLENQIVPHKQSIAEIALRKTFTPERTAELMTAHTMRALEIYHEYSIHPEKLGWRPDQVGSLPTDPIIKSAIENIGDIWEISAGFTVMRLGFVAVNEVLKKEPIKKLTNGYQISDEAAFWASLVSTVTVTTTHSLGMWSGPYNSHVGNPVPEMIFGQGVAAVVLATSHYATKYREPIKNLALRIGRGVVDSSRALGNKLQEFGLNLTDKMNSREIPKDNIFERLTKNMEALEARIEKWDPASLIPSPETIIQKLQNRKLKNVVDVVVNNNNDN